MRLTHLGHACLLAEAEGARILFDPGTMSRFDEVRDVSMVLVTHQHPDRLDPARLGPLLASSPGARLLVDEDTAATVPGLPAHTVVRDGDRFRVGGTRVEVIAAAARGGPAGPRLGGALRDRAG
jgi:L-ascorbate metabolism protein UlaG (beta-lactamase superfamily)